MLVPFDSDVIKLIDEAIELVRIFNATDLTAKKNRAEKNPKIAKSKITKSKNHKL